jgi:hypothetical protein
VGNPAMGIGQREDTSTAGRIVDGLVYRFRRGPITPPGRSVAGADEGTATAMRIVARPRLRLARQAPHGTGSPRTRHAVRPHPKKHLGDGTGRHRAALEVHCQQNLAARPVSKRRKHCLKWHFGFPFRDRRTQQRLHTSPFPLGSQRAIEAECDRRGRETLGKRQETSYLLAELLFPTFAHLEAA